MLKLTEIESFAAKVQVSLPTERPGVFNEGEFTARYKYVPHEDFLQIVDGVREIGDDDDSGIKGVPTTTQVTTYQREVLERVLLGVEGIGDGDGTAYPPEQQRKLVFQHLSLLVATFDAFFSGYRAAPAKNSKRSPKR